MVSMVGAGEDEGRGGVVQKPNKSQPRQRQVEPLMLTTSVHSSHHVGREEGTPRSWKVWTGKHVSKHLHRQQLEDKQT